jgi:hypothetical protein
MGFEPSIEEVEETRKRQKEKKEKLTCEKMRMWDKLLAKNFFKCV